MNLCPPQFLYTEDSRGVLSINVPYAIPTRGISSAPSATAGLIEGIDEAYGSDI